MYLKNKLFGNYVHNEDIKLVCILTGAHCTDDTWKKQKAKVEEGKEKEDKKKKISVQCLYKYNIGEHIFLK